MGSGNNYGGFMGLIPSNNVTNQQTNGTQVNTNQFDANAKGALDAALNNTAYNKGAAVADANSAMQSAVNYSLQAGAPAISSAAKQAGGYNSTTQGMLSNDLTARSAAAGSSVLLNNIQNYAGITANQIGATTAAVNATKGTTSSTSGVQAQQSGSKGGIGNLLNPGAGAGTVICTQLYRDGYVHPHVYHMDNKYVRKHFSAATVNGYRFWAVPFVYWMRKNKTVYAVGKYFGLAWSNHCASHYTSMAKPNFVGKWLIRIMVPVCWCIGKVIPDVQYYKLWAGS